MGNKQGGSTNLNGVRRSIPGDRRTHASNSEGLIVCNLMCAPSVRRSSCCSRFLVFHFKGLGGLLAGERSTTQTKRRSDLLLRGSLRRGNLCVALALFALRTFYAIHFIHRNSYRFKSDFPLLVSRPAGWVFFLLSAVLLDLNVFRGSFFCVFFDLIEAPSSALFNETRRGFRPFVPHHSQRTEKTEMWRNSTWRFHSLVGRDKTFWAA